MLKKLSLFIFLLFISYSLQAKPLTLILDWFINPDHAPIFVAKQQGFFKQQGIQVKIISPADPADALKMVAAGQADIGVSYQPTFTLAVNQGLPIVRIGTLVNSPLSCVAVLKSSSIKTINDLKGKTIGYSTGGIDNAVLSTMLKHNSLTLKQVKLISFHYGQVQALLSGTVDAVTGVMRNIEIPEMALAGHPARVFYPEDNGVPSYDELIFITNRNKVNDPRLKKFIIAIGEGVRYLKQHPKQSWQNFANNHPALNNAINKKSWFMTIKYFDSTPGKLNKTRYLDFAKFLQQAGLIKKPLPPIKQWALDITQSVSEPPY